MRRAVVVGVAVGALALAGVGALAMFGGSRANAHPNVLIVLWDTVRADHLSVYGHEADTTPSLRAFAESAVVYEKTVAPGMWTVPSHGSMFTGLPPSTHGASFEWRWLDAHHVTLAEHFKEQGYDTFAFSANPNLSRRGANLLQGFDVIQTSWGGQWWPLVRQATRRKLLPKDASTEISLAYRGRRPGNPYYNGAPAAGKALFRWLDGRETDGPWLAYLNYMEAHKPRVPQLKHRRAVMDEARHDLSLQTDVTFLHQLAYGYHQLEYTPEEIEAARSVYDACIRELDEYTQRVFDGLEERGMLDDTIIVVTSDHGETLGEHHRFGHRYGMYQTLLHVPLLVRYPKRLKPARVSEPVTTQDLFATLTDLAEVPPAPTAKYSQSLLGTVHEALFSEVLSFDLAGFQLVRRAYPAIPPEGWAHTFRSVRAGDLKLIVDDEDHAELYDLETDPMETEDLAEARPADVEALRGRMTAHWAEIPPYDREARTEEDRPAALSRKEKAMLEVLGYVSDDEGDDGDGTPDDELPDDGPVGDTPPDDEPSD
ncbi:MAG: sulfatase [Myxococcota bacterium]